VNSPDKIITSMKIIIGAMTGSIRKKSKYPLQTITRDFFNIKMPDNLKYIQNIN